MSPTPPLTETDHAGGERARSLSPSQSGRALLKTVDMNRFRNTAEQILNGLDESASPCFSIAMNKVESLLVTPRGDLLVCRDRTSAAAFERESSIKTKTHRSESPIRWCENDIFQESTLCNPCASDNTVAKGEPKLVFSVHSGGLKGGFQQGYGLLGGAVPVKKSEPLLSDNSPVDEKDEPKEVGSSTKSASIELSIVPSFDYSHFDGTDMLPSARDDIKTKLSVATPTLEVIVPPQKKERQLPDQIEVPHVLHGVPTFLPALSQVQIKKLSAHPLGSHVLMISSEALLFSYGLNVHGQLGLGIKSALNDNSGFITTPIIVTPLLENGGKAVACAAGVNHSLVVVRTEGRRVGRLQSGSLSPISPGGAIAINRVTSSPSRLISDKMQTDDDVETIERAVYIHQLYGFGKNDYMKLGLLNPPQTGVHDEDVLLPKRVALQCQVWPDADGGGIFSVAAGEFHSAALVHQPTGAVELYTWGDATHGALGLPPVESDERNPVLAPRILAKPYRVETLSYHPSYSRRGKGQPPLNKKSLLSSVDRSVLVTTGSRPEVPLQVALGRHSTFVVTTNGRCFSFGNCMFGLLGHGKRQTSVNGPTSIIFPPKKNGENPPSIKSVSIGAKHALATCEEGQVYRWGTDAVSGEADWHPQVVDCSGVVKACAGFDSSIVVKHDGKTLSFGKGSGRLGIGEGHIDQQKPIPLFGGLHLWC